MFTKFRRSWRICISLCMHRIKPSYLIRRLVNLKFKDRRNALKYLNNFQEIMNQLAIMKLFLDDEVHALISLSSFSDSCETLVVILSNSIASDIFTLTMMKNDILNEANRRKEQHLIGTCYDALVTKHRGRSKNWPSYSKKNGEFHYRKNKNKLRDQSKSQKCVICYYCNKLGYFQREHRSYKRD